MINENSDRADILIEEPVHLSCVFSPKCINDLTDSSSQPWAKMKNILNTQ